MTGIALLDELGLEGMDNASEKVLRKCKSHHGSIKSGKILEDTFDLGIVSDQRETF